jgi:hypothetical protein
LDKYLLWFACGVARFVWILRKNVIDSSSRKVQDNVQGSYTQLRRSSYASLMPNVLNKLAIAYST